MVLFCTHSRQRMSKHLSKTKENVSHEKQCTASREGIYMTEMSTFNFLNNVTAIFQLVNLPCHIKISNYSTNVFKGNMKLMRRNKRQETESYNWDTFDHQKYQSPLSSLFNISSLLMNQPCLA